MFLHTFRLPIKTVLKHLFTTKQIPTSIVEYY